ncbi:MAG: tripartite tricarboxylate transporter substrate binding protein, partial [Burkholderiales bacterium]
RTSPAVIARLNHDIVKALGDPKLREQLAREGVDAVGSTPREFSSFIRLEIEKWSKAVKESGAKVE